MEQQEATAAETPRPATAKKTMWEILNAPFALFVMTSIVVSGLSYFYQEYANYRKQVDGREMLLSHLRTEIRYRMDVLSYLVQPTFTSTSWYTAHGALIGEFGNKNSANVIMGEYSPIYPDFAQRSVTSLLWELQETQRKTDKAFSLQNSIDAARRLSSSMNERVEMITQGVSGKHDPIWHFINEPAEGAFREDIRLIRASVSSRDSP